MRGALEGLDGVTDITTDIPARSCTFNWSNETVDLTAELDKISETNQHVAGYSMVNEN